MQIAILRFLTSVFNCAARWAHNHQRAIVSIATVLAAGVVASFVAALVYLFYLIHLLSQLV
jgi:hypothetical protein